MLKRAAVIIALSIAAFSAQATDVSLPKPTQVVVQPKVKNDVKNVNRVSNANTNSNKNSSVSSSVSKTAQEQSAVSRSKSRSDAQASANGSNNAQQTVINQARRNPVATAHAPTIIPTADCAVGFGGGVQGTVAGISLGGSRINADCERRATATIAHNFGDRATAEEILCEDPVYRRARDRVGRACAPVVEVVTVESFRYPGEQF